eukprot:8535583-Alexandrium_andersonii.AAC.1
MATPRARNLRKAAAPRLRRWAPEAPRLQELPNDPQMIHSLLGLPGPGRPSPDSTADSRLQALR